MKFIDEARPTLANTDWTTAAAELAEQGHTEDARVAVDQYLSRADARDVARSVLDSALRGSKRDHLVLQLVADAVDEPDLRLVSRMSDAVQRAFRAK